ncbi:MAG: sulfurtransferase TusA family protein [Gemmatimonadota bacterium]|jgi:tRNA 2-thiouridine synthesizing protein A
MNIHFDVELDARGLLCPLPILKTRFKMDTMASGQILRVISTDAGSVKDMEAFARQTDNELLSSATEGGEYVFLLKKA